MPYCPNCLTEYIAGTSECEDCRVRLVPGSPPEIEDEADSSAARKGFGAWLWSLVSTWRERKAQGPPAKAVRIRVFSGGRASLDAAVARKLLQARGIPSVLEGETSAEVLPVLEVSLMVREEDADRAAAILRNYFDKSGPILAE
jgi:Putative prokaryotic signal transducing protein